LDLPPLLSLGRKEEEAEPSLSLYDVMIVLAPLSKIESVAPRCCFCREMPGPDMEIGTPVVSPFLLLNAAKVVHASFFSLG